MTPTQIALVQQSFRRIAPHSETAAALFYQNLFDFEPSLRPMFGGDLKVQGRKLMSMLATIVAVLERPDQLIPTVQALGARHAGYGVEPEHYDTVAAALLRRWSRGLGRPSASRSGSLDDRLLDPRRRDDRGRAGSAEGGRLTRKAGASLPRPSFKRSLQPRLRPSPPRRRQASGPGPWWS
jgi:hemoglobin-like flavoprotein